MSRNIKNYASICGTDVAVYNHGKGLGHKITIGGEFGHKVVCRIKEKGKNVTGLEEAIKMAGKPDEALNVVIRY